MKFSKIIDIIWLIVIFIGLGIGYYAKDISTGEFYLSLMLWVFVSRELMKDVGEDK